VMGRDISKILFLRVIYLTVIMVMIAIELTNASQYTLTGIVLDSESKKPIHGASVIIEKSNAGTETDSSGRFVLNNMYEGSYILQVSHIGYETKEITCRVDSEKQSENLTIHLVPKIVMLKGIVVSPGQYSLIETPPNSHENLSQQTITNMPQINDDAFRAVARLPGIAANDFSARFTVRGGEYNEVLVNLDGMRLYEPFHLKEVDGGVISIIDGSAIQNIDLMTGGFSSKYGDKLSGVFDITSKQVQPDKKSVSAGVSFVTAFTRSEGTFDHNKGSWLLSARKGYAEYVLNLSEEGKQIVPKYYDVFSKVQYQIGKNSVVAIHTLHAKDKLTFIGEDENSGDTARSQYANSYVWFTLWSNLSQDLTSQTVLSTGQVNHKRYGLIPGLYHVSDINDFMFTGLKTDWDYNLSGSLSVQMGGEIQDIWANYIYWGRDNYGTRMSANFKRNGTKRSFYISSRAVLSGHIITEAGLRNDWANYSSDNVVSPRISCAYVFRKGSILRASWGNYYQLEGIDEIAVGYGERVYHPAQKCEQYVIGFEKEFSHSVSFRIEAYQKLYSHLRPSFSNASNSMQTFPEVDDDRIMIDHERKKSHGIELFLKRDGGGIFSWWFNYTYAKVTDSVKKITSPSEYFSKYSNIVLPGSKDQRHSLNCDFLFRPTPRWLISTSFQLHSGWPYSTAHYDSTYIEYRHAYMYSVTVDPLWSSRYPLFHQLDMRISRIFPLSRGKITFYVEIYNVYNRKNTRFINEDFDETGTNVTHEHNEEDWLGRIPSLGISWNWTF
jgi:hypothetical protein